MEENERNLLATARIRNQESGARKRGRKKSWGAANPEIETKPDLSRSTCRCFATFKNATPCLPPPTRARFTPRLASEISWNSGISTRAAQDGPTQRERGHAQHHHHRRVPSCRSNFCANGKKLPHHWDCSFEKYNRKRTNCERELRGHCKGIIKFNHSTSAAHEAAAAASGARVDAAVAGQDSEHLVKDVDVRWLDAFDIPIALEFQRCTPVSVVWRGRVEAPEFLRVLVRT